MVIRFARWHRSKNSHERNSASARPVRRIGYRLNNNARRVTGWKPPASVKEFDYGKCTKSNHSVGNSRPVGCAVTLATIESQSDVVARVVRELGCGTSGCECVATARKGHGLTHCPTHADHTPSLNVRLKDGEPVCYCHGGCDVRDVLTHLTARGLWPERSNGHDATDWRRERINAAWHQTRTDDGTLAAYFRHRGLDGTAVPSTLRLHSSLEYRVGQTVTGMYPAMLALFRHVDGRVAGLHRTYLGSGGIGRPDVPVVKKWLAARDGSTRGAAIHLAEPIDGLLSLAEGIETGLAVQQATGTPVWACGSAGNLEAVALPESVREVLVWADCDVVDKKGNRAGQHAAEVAASRLQAEGRTVRVLIPDVPDRDKTDWLDVSNLAGPEALCRAQAAAQPWQPKAEILSDGTPSLIASESIFTFRTARQLAETTASETAWIVYGLVAEGAITEVDGAIKRAGKTTLITRLVAAVLHGDKFLDFRTRRTKVVYLTEQPDSTFRVALQRAGLLDRDDLFVLTWSTTRGKPWAEVALAAVEKCKEVGARLLVVDTLGQFAGLDGDQENSSGKALEAMRPLQVAAADGLGVMMARHDRKSGGEVGESGRGSSAFAGCVDIILALRRGEGNTRDTVRALHGLSRFDETPTTLMIELTESGYVALGSESAVAAKEARIAILDAAPGVVEKAIKEDGLIAAAGVRRSTGREAMATLLGTGALQKVGEGKKNDPYRYWRSTGPEKSEMLSDGLRKGVPSESISGTDSTVTRNGQILSDGTPQVPSESISAEEESEWT